MRANTARCVKCVLYFGPYKTLQNEYTLGSSRHVESAPLYMPTPQNKSLSLSLSLSPDYT